MSLDFSKNYLSSIDGAMEMMKDSFIESVVHEIRPDTQFFEFKFGKRIKSDDIEMQVFGTIQIAPDRDNNLKMFVTEMTWSRI